MKKILSFFTGTINSNEIYIEIIYLLFRIHVGFTIAFGAGLSKVFHKIDEKGTDDWTNLAFGVPEWFVKQVGEIGFTFPNPTFWAYAATYGEFIGGLCIIFGIFTRFSALQLAFQFFVISYIWYDNPEFITGMYFQQLYFFCFILILGFGSGKLSLDYIINKKKSSN
jgi:uncharacterized membrane protein YphA (DoxX/SURF4 family)